MASVGSLYNECMWLCHVVSNLLIALPIVTVCEENQLTGRIIVSCDIESYDNHTQKACLHGENNAH